MNTAHLIFKLSVSNDLKHDYMVIWELGYNYLNWYVDNCSYSVYYVGNTHCTNIW